jgi:hypothetical protein
MYKKLNLQEKLPAVVQHKSAISVPQAAKPVSSGIIIPMVWSPLVV